jgi:EmrB/QacA subfamily drug resistance transporter
VTTADDAPAERGAPDPGEAAGRPRPTLSPLKVAVVFAGILLGTTVSGMDASIVATAAPTIVAELGQISLLPWLTTAYLLAQATTLPVYGKLGDIYGRRRVFSAALLVFVAASALCGISTSMPMLIACRALQGAGAGGIVALGMALVVDLVPPEKLGRYLGYTGLVFAVTSVLGPWIGGLFVEHLTWRWAFYINAPLVALCLLALTMQPVQTHLVRHRVDLLGAVLLGGGLAAILLALGHETGGDGWTSPRSLGLFGIGLGAIVGFVAWERRVSEPLLPMRLLADRTKACAMFGNFAAGVGFTCGIIYPPIFFQAVAGIDASQSGLLLAPFAFSCALFTLLAGQLTDRVGGYKVIPLLGTVFLALGYALLGTIDASTSTFEVAFFAVVAGVGVGFVMQTLLYVIQRMSTPADIGVATSTTMLARILGGSVGVAVLGGAFTSRLAEEVERRLPGFPVADVQGSPDRVAALADEVRAQVQEAFASGLAFAFKVAVPVMVLGFVAVALIPGRKVRAAMAESHETTVVTEPVAPGV